MIQKMDTSIDPCIDFYNYSCGGWDANNFLPEGSGYWDILQELRQDNNLRLRQLLDGSAEDEIVAVHYMRELYQTCTIRGEEQVLTELEEKWGCVALQTSWKLEDCLKYNKPEQQPPPSSGSSLSPQLRANEPSTTPLSLLPPLF